MEKEKKWTSKELKKTIYNLKKSFKYVKENRKRLIFYISLSLIMAPIGILTPLLSAKLLLNLNGGLYEDLIKVALFMLIIYIVQNILRYIQSLIYKKYTINATYGIKKELMMETFNLKVKCFDEHGTGLFIDRLRNDTNSIINIFERISDIIIDIINDIGILLVIFSVSKIMFIYFIFTGLVTFILDKLRMNVYYKEYDKIRDLEEANTGLVNELIRGVRDIKVLNSKPIFMKKFEERITNVNNEHLRLSKKIEKIYLIGDIIKDITVFIFFALGVLLINKKLLLPSSFLVLYMYKDRVRWFFNYFTLLIEQLKSFNLSANRIFEIVDGKVFPKEKFGNKTLPKIKGDFVFKNVSFSYKEDKEVLHNISFKVNANETVAFVGKSGSGKTTIFNLLNRLYDNYQGDIFIDNYNINDLTCDAIRNNMSIITQNPYIFNLSIRDNLLLVRDDATMEELITATKLACLHDFIMSLPDGYDTIVGEGGVTLSGGERQRLAIARALIKKTEIILFDEATSALDNETQEKIQEAIRNLKGEYTILIIAHRLSTIINSDRIFVIDKGTIVDSGSHLELLRKCKEYKSLYNKEIEKGE